MSGTPPTNTLAAEAWAAAADAIDLQLSPLGLRAIDALAPRAGEHVLDIGCGAGQTILQLAERVGPTGKVIGVDIAPLLLDIARRRAEGRTQIDLLTGDAQTLALAGSSVDCIYSRFGVMAFRDAIAAFANFRRMLKPSGRLAFVCWRALEENELDLLPLRAAGLEDRIDPTPFSFADASTIRATLEAASLRRVDIQAHDAMVSSGNLEAMLEVLLRVGPLGKIVRENPQLGPAVEPRVRAALVGRGGADAVALNAATWIVTAQR